MLIVFGVIIVLLSLKKCCGYLVCLCVINFMNVLMIMLNGWLILVSFVKLFGNIFVFVM